MKTNTRFIPESLSGALKSILTRALGLAILTFSFMLVAALVFRDPYLAGPNVSSSFGDASIIEKIVSVVSFGIGWIPTLFLFLYIARQGTILIGKWENPAPEYDALRAFVAIGFGAIGYGSTAPSFSFGGIAGFITAHDLSGLIGVGPTIFIGILSITIFMLLAGSLLHIKWENIKSLIRGLFKFLRWIAGALHLISAVSSNAKKLEKYEEEPDEEPDEPQEKTVTKLRSIKNKTVKKSTAIQNSSIHDYKLPSPEFLEKSIFTKNKITDELRRNATAMEANFANYGVLGHVAGIKPGPIVTLYEFEPDDGMRIAKITDTVADMTRAMATEKIRIAPIPRTKYIGVEMVNIDRQTVRYQSMMSNPDFIESPFKLPLALGVNIGGLPVIVDLAKMPHALIAGRTGSGKSVFVQSIIMSIVYHYTPDECKLVIIDPKGVDFTLWRDIPHLITPVVTDANQAVNVLKWSVREMEDRYGKLKKMGVQNIEGYNEAVAEARNSGKKMTEQVAVGTDPETGELEFEEREIDLTDMPYLVVIIDEVADLMSVARKEIEACVQRLAQKARAAGIHLVAATQRPDTSVITGVIKANFPTRISFQARSNIDSMTTLGEKGAEQLLSSGDMLFSEAGRVPVRIHSALIENREINKVADFWRKQGEPKYNEGVTENEESQAISGISAAIGKISKDEKDGDLYRQAIEIVLRDKKPTISYLQRRLQIGYNKAATFIERMESEGIVSAPDANNKRHIL